MTDWSLSIIIPANNEAKRIGACLRSLLDQRDVEGGPVQVIVVPNGCTDDTAEVARGLEGEFDARGWQLIVVQREQGGKIGALNQGDEVARAPSRLYLDADILCGPTLLKRLVEALDCDRPVYAGAKLEVPRSPSAVSRLYARFWTSLPFLTKGVCGAGLFAVNGHGRRRWDRYPEIIADDAFVRGLFSPGERVRIHASYSWPISDGARALVRVRGRQNDGMHELARRYPALMKNLDDSPTRRELARLAAADPLGFAVYSTIAAATRLRRDRTGWARNR